MISCVSSTSTLSEPPLHDITESSRSNQLVAYSLGISSSSASGLACNAASCLVVIAPAASSMALCTLSSADACSPSRVPVKGGLEIGSTHQGSSTGSMERKRSSGVIVAVPFGAYSFQHQSKSAETLVAVVMMSGPLGHSNVCSTGESFG